MNLMERAETRRETFYKLTNSADVPSVDNSWSTATLVPTQQQRYLWKFEYIYYSDGSVETVGPVNLSIAGADADTSGVTDAINKNNQAVAEAKQQLTTVANDLTQAKQDLASQAQQLQAQASAQSELTKRVSTVEKTADGTKTTVSELSKTVAQNGKDITSVTARTKVVEDDLTSTKTTLTQVQTTADGASSKAATLETGLNGVKADLTATTTTANTTKTNLANYQASNDKMVASLKSSLQTTDGNVSNLQTKVEAVPGQITSAVSAVEGKIPTSIGARNYIRDYGLTATGWITLKPAWKFEIISDSTAKSGQYLKATCTTARTGIGGFYKNLFDFSDGRFFGKQMTWSMDVKTSKNAKLTIGCEWGKAQTNVNVTENWQRFSKTFDVATSSEGKAWIFYSYNWNVGDIVYIRDIQLEDGPIATSPVPAIEDTESDISNLSSQIKQTADGMTLLATKTELNSAKNELQSGINTATNKANSNAQTISTHTTQISALNTGLQAKVSQTDFNTLSGRVTSAENNITAKANELSSKISSVEGKIPTEIGSSNLLRKTAVNTENLKLFSKTDTTVSIVEKDRHQVYKLVVSGSNNAGAYFNGNYDYYNLVKDRNYTFSFWVLTNKDKSYSFGSLGHIQAINNNGDAVGDYGHQHTTPVYSTNVIRANTWTKVWCTFKATSNSFFRPYFWYLRAGDEIYIYDMMLNEGKVPLSYTPALEDTISQIDAVSSELKQTTDSIKASVSSLDKSTIKSSSLTINADGIVMKAGKSTTDVANAIGSYFAVNQNAIDLFADKIKVKGNMIVNGAITGDKIKANSVDVSKIVGIDANFIKSKIEYAMIDWLKGKTITAYNDNMTIDLQDGRISFKDGSNAVYRQTPDGIHTGFLHFEAGSQGGIYAAFGATSTRQGINSKSSEFAGIRCYRVSANGDSHEAKIDKIEVIGDTVQFGHGYRVSDGKIGGGFIMDTAAFGNETPYSMNRVIKSIEALWRILHDHAKNTGYRFNDPAFINALNNEYNAWHDMHND